MIRPLLIVLLFASAATAQVDSYPGSFTRGGIAYRPFVNTSTYGGNYLPSQVPYLNPATGTEYTAAGYSRFAAPTPSSAAAVYRYLPQYTSQLARFSPTTLCRETQQSAPLLRKPFYSFVREAPVEQRPPCDPYTDEYGCLYESY
jgi:hypothetical protein